MTESPRQESAAPEEDTPAKEAANMWAEIDEPDAQVPGYAFASRYSAQTVPTMHLPRHPFAAVEAYQVIQDLRQLDHNPRMNLASFATTWMEPEAERVMTDALNVNFIDSEQYRSCQRMQGRCVAMLASLYGAPDAEHATGTSCVGSSEAIMLAALSMKKAWMQRRREAGQDTSSPNLVMGSHVQVCWEKFCRYFDVEARLVPVSPGHYTLTVADARARIDENTIGLVGILGSTYNGQYDDIEALDALSSELRAERGWQLPIHVDAASGGFVAPFVSPDLRWDFRLPNVASINVSGHKYGLVYVGIGWLIFRDAAALHPDLLFRTSYLGSAQPNITLNFSRGACNVVGQYYQFLRLGFDGYRAVMKNLMTITAHLRRALEATGLFDVLSDARSLPLVAFAVRYDARGSADAAPRPGTSVWDEFDLSDKLRQRGWMVPAYSMPLNAQHVQLLRIVVREDLSSTLMESLVEDVQWAVDWLNKHFVFEEKEITRIRANVSSKERQASEVRGRSCA